MLSSMGPIVILSPHFDDAVLSCWDLLAGGHDVRVVNVFAGAPEPGTAGWWDDLAGGDVDAASSVRRRAREDRRALAPLGRRSRNLAFLDAQYRSGPQPLVALVDAVRRALPPGALVLGPAAVTAQPRDAARPAHMGYGPHPDHVAARSAALALRDEGFAAGLYADLPHASGLTGGKAAAWDEAFARAGLALDGLAPVVRRLGPEAFERKLAGVRAYASQVAMLERAFGALDDPDLLGREVLFLPRR
jgi:LmbE family N-acetylglucosaminyl deacetylase